MIDNNIAGIEICFFVPAAHLFVCIYEPLSCDIIISNISMYS